MGNNQSNGVYNTSEVETPLSRRPQSNLVKTPTKYGAKGKRLSRLNRTSSI